MLALSLCHAELNRPADGQELSYVYVLFDWDQEPNSDSYNLQVSNSESFNNVILDINEKTTVYIEKDTIAWGNMYYWRVRPIYSDNSYGEWSEVSYFTTDEPILQKFNANIYSAELIQNGLIIFCELTPSKNLGVIDKDGNVIWSMDDKFFSSVNEYGQLFGGYLDPPSHYVARMFNFENDTLYQLWSVGGGLDNHEFRQIPNGNYMIFIQTFELGPIPLGDWTQNYQNLGYVADGVTNEFPWKGYRIVEFDKDTKEQVWNWNAFDHFTIDDYDAYGGTWNYSIGYNWYDWLHANAFYFDEVESVIYISFRSLSRISKIAYPSGDVIWNMGLPEQYGVGDDNICTDLLFSFQHHIQLLDNGDLLFFDNGNLSEMLLGDPNPITRIRRIRVVDNSYCETVWQYDLPPYLYAHSVGSVQLLDNGNYSISTMGNGLGTRDFKVLEVTPDQDLIWEVTSDTNTIWYRSYNIPSLHPDAFSVLLDRYRNVEFAGDSISGIVLDDENAYLSFTIFNKSGYSQPYVYTISDKNGWFNESSDTVAINAYEQFTIALEPMPIMVQQSFVTNLILDCWPLHHDYAMKSMNYDVYSMLSFNEDFIPSEFALYNNYPNPFNPVTTLRYDLAEDALVNIIIYNVLGSQVKTLINQTQDAGYRSVIWDATNDYGKPVSAGIYLYQIQAGEYMQTKKMVLLK